MTIEPFVEGYSAGKFDLKDTSLNRLKVVWEVATERLNPVTYDDENKSDEGMFFIDFDTDDHEQWKVELTRASSEQQDPTSPFRTTRFGIEISRTEGW